MTGIFGPEGIDICYCNIMRLAGGLMTPGTRLPQDLLPADILEPLRRSPSPAVFVTLEKGIHTDFSPISLTSIQFLMINALLEAEATRLQVDMGILPGTKRYTHINSKILDSNNTEADGRWRHFPSHIILGEVPLFGGINPLNVPAELQRGLAGRLIQGLIGTVNVSAY